MKPTPEKSQHPEQNLPAEKTPVTKAFFLFFFLSYFYIIFIYYDTHLSPALLVFSGHLQAKAAEDPVAILQAAHEAANLSKVCPLLCPSGILLFVSHNNSNVVLLKKFLCVL